MAVINRLDASSPDFQARLNTLLAVEAEQDEAIDRAAADILADVRRRGDDALLHYTQKFDRVQAQDMAALEIPKAEWHAALAALPAAQRNALE
ncbi:MAG: histidinol dehydrogenase, partial [Comamonadaceae bacterium]